MNDKTAILLIIAGTIVLAVLSWFPDFTEINPIQPLVTGALLWFLYLGKAWARWFLGVCYSLVGLTTAGIVASGEPVEAPTALLFLMALFYLPASFLLLSGKIVGSHFRSDSA